MFKKILLVLGLLSFMSVFAEKSYGKSWDWNSEDEAKIKVEMEEVKFKPYKKIYAPIQIALIGKNSNNITYDQFKSIINDVTKSVDIKNSSKKAAIVVIAKNLKRFNPFLENIIKEPELKDLSYTITRVAPKFYNTPELFRKYYFVENNIVKIRSDDFSGINDIFNLYKKYSLNYKPDEVKEDVKILKRIVYPNIDKGENWKQLAVKIELLSKSVE